ncbi:hypothetical protein BX600DRAFT_442255 [Xylariales sp. PMI_506]|nr:hypothetical protein BX600DRAFT_442255 [Xylariales sp. PMI_506]
MIYGYTNTFQHLSALSSQQQVKNLHCFNPEKVTQAATNQVISCGESVELTSSIEIRVPPRAYNALLLPFLSATTRIASADEASQVLKLNQDAMNAAAMERQLVRLPWELVIHIMSSLLPTNPATLIPALEPGTQLLLSFCLVCRATQDVAVRKLQQHCVFLDSDDRLRRFLLCLELSRESSIHQLPSVFSNITTMYLSPFGSIMDNLPTASWVRDLFGYTSSSLKRLIVDMPFDSLPPWNDHLNVGQVLHEGFEKLTNLEEFVCTRDIVRLGVLDEMSEERGPRSVLYKLPKLRRLGLNRPMCNIKFWECMADMPCLEHVVLTSALAIIHREFDFRTVYLERTSSPITIVLADIRAYQKTPVLKRFENPVMAEDVMKLLAYQIPIPIMKNFLDSNSEWLMGTALAGDLWDVPGEPIRSTPQLAVS